jgi:hypothetical protein
MANHKLHAKLIIPNKQVSKTANGKNIVKSILIGFGKVFYYFGKGLWIFGKLLGRGIKRAHYEHQANQRIIDRQRQHEARIERESYYAGRGYARGMADVREQERLKRQDIREQREAQKRFNKMWEVPPLNENAFFGEPQTRKKKKRSTFNF